MIQLKSTSIWKLSINIIEKVLEERHIHYAIFITKKIIMRAAHRMLIKLLEDPGGAFKNMDVLLIIPKEKKKQFGRLIKAGSGIVVEAKAFDLIVHKSGAVFIGSPVIT